MKQVEFISRHDRQFDGFDSPDKSSMTEQNLRLSQAEKAIDMANGRIPIIPTAIMQSPPDSSDVLPDYLQSMLGVYHSPYVDPATKSRLRRQLRDAYSEHMSTREAEAQAQLDASNSQKEADYKALLEKLRLDMASSK